MMSYIYRCMGIIYAKTNQTKNDKTPSWKIRFLRVRSFLSVVAVYKKRSSPLTHFGSSHTGSSHFGSSLFGASHYGSSHFVSSHCDSSQLGSSNFGLRAILAQTTLAPAILAQALLAQAILAQVVLDCGHFWLKPFWLNSFWGLDPARGLGPGVWGPGPRARPRGPGQGPRARPRARGTGQSTRYISLRVLGSRMGDQINAPQFGDHPFKLEQHREG